ncbi:PilZ domain-containing protein [Thauera aromatica]|uniref:PilZ domain-containing protein n=1 Tax=Thauera aromatica TaxID=59405 RepID=UPI001FFDAC0A|nr:PilZ domain-containing protein [Thauera aromatica]MCK2089590.1 PilZ domain-containing protein [Thauera aromatica]
MTAERRFAERRSHGRDTPDRRGSDRRHFARWHPTQPLAVGFRIGDAHHQGLLSDISVTGCLVKSAAGAFASASAAPLDKPGRAGIVTFELGSETTAREALLVRHGKDTLGLRFTRELGDALLAHIVTLCEAYSIQYRDGRVHFAGDIGNLPAILHLLKCVRGGTVIDLSRARGDPTQAAASMKLLHNRGARLHGCSHKLLPALDLIARSICLRCNSQCGFGRSAVTV